MKDFTVEARVQELQDLVAKINQVLVELDSDDVLVQFSVGRQSSASPVELKLINCTQHVDYL